MTIGIRIRQYRHWCVRSSFSKKKNLIRTRSKKIRSSYSCSCSITWFASSIVLCMLELIFFTPAVGCNFCQNVYVVNLVSCWGLNKIESICFFCKNWLFWLKVSIFLINCLTFTFCLFSKIFEHMHSIREPNARNSILVFDSQLRFLKFDSLIRTEHER